MKKFKIWMTIEEITITDDDETYEDAPLLPLPIKECATLEEAETLMNDIYNQYYEPLTPDNNESKTN